MNKFFRHPTQDDIKSIADYFMRQAAYHIELDVKDFEQILNGCEGVAVIECAEYGEGRLLRAFKEVEKMFETLVPGLDISACNRCLVQVSFSDKEPLMLNETEAMAEFFAKLPKDTEVIWGIAKEPLPEPYTLSLKIAFAVDAM